MLSQGESEYAQAGVDYAKIEPFKQVMQKVGRKTLNFPQKRGVWVASGRHGAAYSYLRSGSHLWCQTQEGLGNKNWIAEWMYQKAGTGKTYYEGIGIDTALMAVNDVIAQGAMPVVLTDEVAAGESDWFADGKRAIDLASGFYKVCEMVGMALAAGESSSLRYLVRSELPVKSAPVLSAAVTGIVVPASRFIDSSRLEPGDCILGATSSGIHANGISLVIKRGLALPDQFLTKLPNGNTLGEEALIPTRSYVALVESLLKAGVDIHALVPGTGGGVSKVAFDKRPFTYRIQTWVAVPPLFQFMRELGVSVKDCLTTFNWGIGYYIFVSSWEVNRVISIGHKTGYEVVELGQVEAGQRQVIFEPEKLLLPSPGR